MATPLSQAVRSRLKTREAHNAQQRVQDALERGEIRKPAACQRCGKRTDDLQFAHSNYEQRLAGRWLCRSCHRREDMRNPKGGGSGAAGTQRAPG